MISNATSYPDDSDQEIIDNLIVEEADDDSNWEAPILVTKPKPAS